MSIVIVSMYLFTGMFLPFLLFVFTLELTGTRVQARLFNSAQAGFVYICYVTVWLQHSMQKLEILSENCEMFLVRSY